MKRTIFILASIFALSVFSSTNTLQAQRINVSINIGSQPAWGPTGYDYAEFYYMPQINCYYNVDNMLFYYLDRGRWVGVRYLPTYYSRYDMYSMYKVVINGSHNPWRYNNRHRNDYYRYASYHNQPVIRYSDDRRYNNSRRNTYDWVENGRDLHNRNNNAGRGTSENRYSNGRGSVSTREANTTTGRGSSNISTRESSSGRNSNVSTRESNVSRDSSSRDSSSSRTSTRNYDSSSSRNSNATSGRNSNVSGRSSQGSERGSSSDSRSSSSRSSDSRVSSGRTSSGR